MYAFAMPTFDSAWLDQHERFPPPGPPPAQEQPKQTVSWAKAPLRTSQDAELVAQGKNLEQEVSTCHPGRSDRSPVLMTARIACRVPAGDANVNDFRPDAISARQGPVPPGAGRWCFANTRDTTFWSMSIPNVCETMRAIRGQPNRECTA
jgi:hypothetical protein